jgi:hypothetical protein
MIRTAIICETASKHWNLLAENIGKGDTRIFNPPSFPKGEQQGFGFHEAPRGTLSHWIVIENGVIKNYQAVVPSTWNAGPRDAKEQAGPYEASLVGNPVANAELPLEVLRTVHSFDPCIACANPYARHRRKRSRERPSAIRRRERREANNEQRATSHADDVRVRYRKRPHERRRLGTARRQYLRYRVRRRQRRRSVRPWHARAGSDAVAA